MKKLNEVVFRSKTLCFLLVIAYSLIGSVCLGAGPGSATVYTKDNGVIRIRLNEFHYPIITRLDVLNTNIVPHDNAGADLQMTARSPAGNSYNPTQAGDCRGEPSHLAGVIANWSSNMGISSSNGILLGVIPRNYNETMQSPSNPIGVCQGTQPLMPINFNFGVTLGDGGAISRETMVLDMGILRKQGAQELVPIISELPAVFPRSNVMPYVYYSHDGNSFYPFTVSVNGADTHDVTQWPYGINYSFNGKVIMVSSGVTADSGVGLAVYSNATTNFVVGHRLGRSYDLSYIAANGSNNPNERITDHYWHGYRRLVVTGDLSSVRASIAQAKAKFGGGAWTWIDTTTPPF